MLVGSIVAVVEYLDDTVKSPDDVTLAAGAPTLGSIPRFGRPDGWRFPGRRRQSAPRLVDIRFMRGSGRQQTVLVTSALPGEGKSTTVANLAVAIAQTGQRVVVVDADMRRPSQHLIFDVVNSNGLSMLFVLDTLNETNIEPFLRPTTFENLHVLTSGMPAPNSTELLSSERMDQIIALVRSTADTVLIDSPPLLSVSDAAALAVRSDGVVIVTDSRRTRGAALADAVAVLNRAHAPLWGVVLNKLKSEGIHHGTYRSYSARDIPPAQPQRQGALARLRRLMARYPLRNRGGQRRAHRGGVDVTSSEHG
jgi:capsular exopolysaccharide synthesis family protein